MAPQLKKDNPFSLDITVLRSNMIKRSQGCPSLWFLYVLHMVV